MTPSANPINVFTGILNFFFSISPPHQYLFYYSHIKLVYHNPDFITIIVYFFTYSGFSMHIYYTIYSLIQTRHPESSSQEIPQ